MCLKDYLDSYVMLARGVHELSHRTFMLGDDVEVTACDQMSHSKRFIGGYEDIPYVHIHTGLREIAKRLDIVLNEEEDDEDTIRIWFVYRGVEFMQLEDKKHE